VSWRDRIARAVAQGFTRDAYRGEGVPIVGRNFIVGHPSRYDTGYLGGNAIYSTNAPRLANDYSTFKAAKELDPSPNVMPLRVKMENPYTITGEEKAKIAQKNLFDRDAWLQDKYDKGHDGVIVKYGGGYEEYVAPPEQYRSRFAQFDPDKANVNDLLAGFAATVGVPAIGTVAAQDQYGAEQ